MEIMDYTKLANRETLDSLIGNLKERNFEGIVVDSKEAALEKIKELIPGGASVHNGSSTTLQEIGFIDYLKGDEHPWNNLHAKILEETDEAKQNELRKQSIFSDYYLGSIHAVSEKGELVIASASGSQLPHLVYTSPNLIFVVGAQKITPDLESAMERLRNFVYPLEDKRMKSTGAAGSVLAKILILEREPVWSGRKITIIFVNESLGF
jgi:hypothetical protein